jgi:hypothetical protein
VVVTVADDKTKVFSAMRARTQENIARQKAEEYTPTTAYVRDSFISERLRDQGIPIPDDGFYSEDVAREQGAWHRWLAAHDEAVRADMQPREVEVSDDMVRRADAAYWKSANDCDDHADPMRDALVAALGGGE